MKQSLQQKMNQSLAMTPQLQQAIKLLQLSTIDLQAEIQQSLEENPLLEIDEEENSYDRFNSLSLLYDPMNSFSIESFLLFLSKKFFR